MLNFDMLDPSGGPIGNSLGGYLLVQEPVFHTGEIRNYTLIFIIALVFELLSFCWIFFMVNEKIAREQEMCIKMKLEDLNEDMDSDDKLGKVQLTSDMKAEDRDKHPLRLLFDLSNLKAMVTTVIKQRPNKGRLQVITILFSLIITFMTSAGME